jgi:hypothetical protein
MTESSPIARFADAIEPVRSEMAGVTPKAFETDRRKRGLVERGIEIISETSRRLPADMKVAACGNPVAEGRRRRQRASTRLRRWRSRCARGTWFAITYRRSTPSAATNWRANATDSPPPPQRPPWTRDSACRNEYKAPRCQH